MIERERIEAYAEKLRREGELQDITLGLVAADLGLHLARKKPERMKQGLTVNAQLIKPLKIYFKEAFTQKFFEAAAEGILFHLNAERETRSYDGDDFEVMLLSPCGHHMAGEILRNFNAWDLSVETLETLLGLTPQKPASITEPRMCQAKFYEPFPINAINHTVYTASVTTSNFWGVNETSLNGRKDYSKGYIELQIRDRFDITDFTQINYQAKEVIGQQFGEETLRLHYALAVLTFRKEAPWIDEITVSASKLLADFGCDKKKNRYIPKSSIEESNQPVCYISKEERLKQLAHQVRLLKRIEVRVPEWRANKKRTFAVEMSNLWDVFSINEVTQLSANGESKIVDIEITYRPGIWFRRFADNQDLRKFGYITSEALKLDPVQDRMALRLAYFALSNPQQHKTSPYSIRTLLKLIGYESEIEEAWKNPSTASNLKRSFERGLNTLGNFQHPYYFKFDSDAPKWATPGSGTKKPRGWFETWLELPGTLHQPDTLPIREDALAKTENFWEPQTARKSPAIFDPLVFGEEVRKTRKEKGDTLTAMAESLEISKTQLSQIEKGRYPTTINPKVKARIISYLGLSK